MGAGSTRRHDWLAALWVVCAWGYQVLRTGPHLEFDPPLLRALMIGLGTCLFLPGILGYRLDWRIRPLLLRLLAIGVGSAGSVLLGVLLSLQLHAQRVGTPGSSAEGSLAFELLRTGTLSGLPWIAGCWFACRRGLRAED